MGTRPGRTSVAGTAPRTWLARGKPRVDCCAVGTGSNRRLSIRTYPPDLAFWSLVTIVNRRLTLARSASRKARPESSRHIGVQRFGSAMKGQVLPATPNCTLKLAEGE